MLSEVPSILNVLLNIILCLKLFHFIAIRRLRLSDQQNHPTENCQMTAIQSNFPLLKKSKTPKHSRSSQEKKKKFQLPQETKLNFSSERTTFRKDSRGWNFSQLMDLPEKCSFKYKKIRTLFRKKIIEHLPKKQNCHMLNDHLTHR